MKFVTKSQKTLTLGVGDVVECVDINREKEYFFVVKGREMRSGNGELREVEVYQLIKLNEMKLVAKCASLEKIQSDFEDNKLYFIDIHHYRIIKNENIELREV